MPYLKPILDARFGMCLTALLASLAIASPSLAGTMYSWKTEDGGVAYTDDMKNVPARYRNQVRTLTSEKLEGYKHYTPQDEDGAMGYSQQLEARLAHLRVLNAEPMRAAPGAVAAPRGMLGVGGGVEVPIALTGEPIINEIVRVRPDLAITDRLDRVISQGGRVISVIRGDKWTDRRALNGRHFLFL